MDKPKSPKDHRLLKYPIIPAIIVTIIVIVIAIIAADIAFNSGRESVMEKNRQALAVTPTPTCPGIADVSGNCMRQVEYKFTVPELTPTPTPAPFCTPVICANGQLVCPDNIACTNGCGYICQVDPPPKPVEPDMVCLYWWGPPIYQRCYPNLKP